MIKRVALSGLVPVGFQTLTLSNSTAQYLNSTARTSAQTLVFSVETNDLRFRADGSAPTLTTGVLFAKDQTYILDGFTGSTGWKFQRSTGTCKLSVHTFKVD